MLAWPYVTSHAGRGIQKSGVWDADRTFIGRFCENAGLHIAVRTLLETNLRAASAPQTLACSRACTSSYGFYKIARNPLLVLRDGTGRVGERFVVS